MTVVKVDTNLLASIGATGASDFSEKLSAFVEKAKQDEKIMSDTQATIETLQASIKALESKIPTEARISELVTGGATAAIKSWAASDEGKKVIAAESSRITLEALGSVGTQPAKPSPAPSAGGTPEAQAAELIAAGKYEDAFKLDKNAQAEFITAKSYAAFMRNRHSVKVTSIANRN